MSGPCPEIPGVLGNGAWGIKRVVCGVKAASGHPVDVPGRGAKQRHAQMNRLATCVRNRTRWTILLPGWNCLFQCAPCYDGESLNQKASLRISIEEAKGNWALDGFYKAAQESKAEATGAATFVRIRQALALSCWIVMCESICDWQT